MASRTWHPVVTNGTNGTKGTECNGMIANAGVAAVASTIFVRIALGTLLECFGPVNVQASLLTFGAFWVAMAAAISAPWNYALTAREAAFERRARTGLPRGRRRNLQNYVKGESGCLGWQALLFFTVGALAAYNLLNDSGGLHSEADMEQAAMVWDPGLQSLLFLFGDFRWVFLVPGFCALVGTGLHLRSAWAARVSRSCHNTVMKSRRGAWGLSSRLRRARVKKCQFEETGADEGIAQSLCS